MSFETNVFVNCPFDDAYFPILRPILFCILDLGLEPRIALEAIDSGEARIERIIKLIEESRFAIHNLSRLRAERAGEFYRLNMPFELGLDVGCRRFRGGKWSRKRCLILEAERYRYQAALSDMSNSDIGVHGNEPADAVSAVRNWLNSEGRLHAPGPARIWARFNSFMADHYDQLVARGFSKRDIERLPVDELVTGVKGWAAQASSAVTRRFPPSSGSPAATLDERTESQDWRARRSAGSVQGRQFGGGYVAAPTPT